MCPVVLSEDKPGLNLWFEPAACLPTWEINKTNIFKYLNSPADQILGKIRPIN